MNCYYMFCYYQEKSITTNKTPISRLFPLLSCWSTRAVLHSSNYNKFSVMKIPLLSPSLGNHLSNWKVCILPVEAERIEQSDAELSPIFFSHFSQPVIFPALKHSNSLCQKGPPAPAPTQNSRRSRLKDKTGKGMKHLCFPKCYGFLL